MKNANRLINSYEENLLKSNERKRKNMKKYSLGEPNRKLIEKRKKESTHEAKIKRLVNKLESILE